MFKAIKNLLILALVALLAVGISIKQGPVNNSDHDLRKYSSSDVYLSYDQKDQILFNPEDVKISHQSFKRTTLQFKNDYIFKAKILKDNKVYKEIDLYHLNDEQQKEVSISNNEDFITSVDISQDKLKLPNGIYEIQISTSAHKHSDNVLPVSINVEYKDIIPYNKAVYKSPKGKIGLTLYYPNTNYSLKQLIGVTRFVNYTKRILNTTLNELRDNPLNIKGMSDTSTIGEYYYSVFDKDKRRIIYVDLKSEEKIYTNSFYSKTAMNSILKSLTRRFPSYNIKFLVDRVTADTFFNGEDVSKPIKYDWKNKLYLAYNSGERYFLVDYQLNINEMDDLDSKVNKIFNILKIGADNLEATVHKDIKLLDYNLKGNVLTLNFNNKFIDSFEDINKNQLMLDSILTSFTNINGVKYIKITVNGKTVNNFADINISKPLASPPYINPDI